jgi:hypothetical protein
VFISQSDSKSSSQVNASPVECSKRRVLVRRRPLFALVPCYTLDLTLSGGHSMCINLLNIVVSSRWVQRLFSAVAHREVTHVSITGMGMNATTSIAFWHTNINAIASGLAGVNTTIRVTLCVRGPGDWFFVALRADELVSRATRACDPAVWLVR